jgi:hypothetical protein
MTERMGPLTVSADNPRYFADGTGRIVVLTGSHTWNSLHDLGPRERVVPFDWDGYLDLLETHGHNFIRAWAFNSLATWNPADEVLTTAWLRTGPGTAWDGKPRLDLERPDPAFYARLRERCRAAGRRGIYVSVMLFEHWSNFDENETPLQAHMFAGGNNVNGIDILRTRRLGAHPGWSGLEDPAVLAVQCRHVADCFEALRDLDNVLWEIANEVGPVGHDWLDYMTAHLRELMAEKGVRQPVGQTGGMHTLAARLHASDADWVSPDAGALDIGCAGYRTAHHVWGEGPAERGDRPILVDTDHVWGVGGSVAWVWKTMLRGYNLLYMDPWSDQPAGFFRHPRWPVQSDPGIRRAMGLARRLLERTDLARARPANALASTGYCTADPGRVLLTFAPEAGPFTLELPAAAWRAEWYRPDALIGTGFETARIATRRGTTEFTAPWEGPSVLFIERA